MNTTQVLRFRFRRQHGRPICRSGCLPPLRRSTFQRYRRELGVHAVRTYWPRACAKPVSVQAVRPAHPRALHIRPMPGLEDCEGVEGGRGREDTLGIRVEYGLNVIDDSAFHT
jgi:hypothetical protein